MASVMPCEDVRPSDSVSNSDGQVLSGFSGSSLQPPVSPFTSLGDFQSSTSARAQVYGEIVSRYYDSYNSYLMMHAQFSSSSASLPTASVVSGGSGGSSGSKLTGLSGSRARSARRAALWRAKCALPRTYPEGCCYTRLFISSAKQSVSESLLFWPSLAEVLSQPADVATSLCLNDGLRLVSVGSNRYHVLEPSLVPEGSESWSLNDALVGLARRSEFLQGSLGNSLRSQSRPGAGSRVLSLLNLQDKLGGTASGSEVHSDAGGAGCGIYPPAAGSAGGVFACDFSFDGMSSIDFRKAVLSWTEEFSSRLEVSYMFSRLCVSYGTSRATLLFTFPSYEDALLAVAHCPPGQERGGGKMVLTSFDARMGFSRLSSTPGYVSGSAGGMVSVAFGPGGYDHSQMESIVSTLLSECALLSVGVQATFSRSFDGSCVLYLAVKGSRVSLLGTGAFSELVSLAKDTGFYRLGLYDALTFVTLK